jgi:adenine-specific DNA glycosylase
LLANLWQFPSLPLPLGLSDAKIVATAESGLDESYDVTNCSPRLLGRVPHQFSHISQVYVVLSLKLSKNKEPITPAQAKQWVHHKDINDLAIPTGMKKVTLFF